VLGWIADFIRLYWGLVYWNTRKTWFRLRRGRSPCPCQTPSDSGRAFETGCEACLHWAKPLRFRRVCPLLVETKDGLRCSADTAEVRPFWRRTFAWYGGTLGACYGVLALTVFIFLRTVGYPVSVFDVALPPLWHRLDRARAWYFFEQSKRAFSSGRSNEGLLYLANAYDFDPTNYQIGITLAKNYQVGQPAQSDRVFARLIKDHPDRSAVTAWDWYRALLQRGSFDRIITLARDQVVADPEHAHAWIRALLFATRQMRDETALRELAANPAPTAAAWHRLIETELFVRAGRTREARLSLDRPWPKDSPAFTVVYRVTTLIALGDTFAALDLNDRSRQIIGDEAWLTLKLDALATRGVKNDLRNTVELLLAQRSNLASIKVLCAHLIRHPDAEVFARLADKVDREKLPLNPDTAGVWFSLLCTAGVVGDENRLATLTGRLKSASQNPFVALILVQRFFQGQTAERHITSFLPILPLPIEVTYALIERYPAPVQTVMPERAVPDFPTPRAAPKK
jgi:hypothetical protein